MFAFEERRGATALAFTDRHGGTSRGAYASLNLAGAGGDDPALTARNRALAVAALTGGPAPLATMHQVHGADVHVVDTVPSVSSVPPVPPVPAGPGVADQPRADALVTRLPGVVLMVRTADCVPLVLADVERGVVAVAHAGRPGMVAGVVPRVLSAMRDQGARAVHAWVGPHVCGRCYEVPATMRDDVAAVVPESAATTSWGTPAVDIGAGVAAQLRYEGVETVTLDRCTIEDEDLFSYRRQGPESGRLAGMVWRAP
ncbi:MAG TPA: polyphenol oxidase family protein [Nocardioidaceae bacterium]|nr:polyphenol oxidase family protein [Nocardioidaceae bacterium]